LPKTASFGSSSRYPHEKVTIGVVNFNGNGVLEETLHALEKLDYPECEILVIDNGSTDGSRDWLRERTEKFQCVFLSRNVGSAAARNVLLKEACSDYIFFLDNDIRVEPDALSLLMRALREVPNAGLCHPEIRDDNDPGVFHYNGGYIHYLCALIARTPPVQGWKRPSVEVFDVISGAALLVRRDLALSIGGFDEDYFFNWEDGDFTVRFTLSGFRCLNVPDAAVHHRNKPRGTSKVYYQVRNRWYFILKFYSSKTIFAITPMLILFEIIQAPFFLFKGVHRDYLRGTFSAIQDFPQTMVKRRKFMAIKKIRDREWLRAGDPYVPPQLDARKRKLSYLKSLCFKMFNGYWRLVSRYC
jgi:GT2 family glycosyltransferase